MTGLLRLLLQPLLSTGHFFAAAWIIALTAPVFAWLLATAFVGPGAGSRLWRGAIAMGWAGLGSVALFLLLRLLEGAGTLPHGGPLGWLDAAWTPTTPWKPAEAVAVLALVHGLALFLFALIGALLERGRSAPLRIPLSGFLGALLVSAAVLAPPLMLEAYSKAGHQVLIDLAALLPMLGLSLAIWTQSERVAPPKPAPLATALAAGPPQVDVVGHWRKLAALGAETPLAQSAAFLQPPGAPQSPEWIAAAWRDAGAEGPPPQALEEIAFGWSAATAEGALVGDLPDPTEQRFLVACLLLAIRRLGLPCLVVSAEPRELRDAVADALQRGGSWSCGPLVAGERELREVFAGGRLPAAVFLDVAGLSGQGLRMLSGQRGDPASLFLKGLGLLVLPQVDRGAPLALTHRVFTLRRLALRLAASGAHPHVLATGFGGVGTRTLLEQGLPGLVFREVSFGRRAAAAVRAFPVSEAFRLDKRGPWVKRALQEVAALGQPVSVGDPHGAFDQRTAGSGERTRFVRDVALDGVASASILDEAWLVAAFRALPNRLPIANAVAHDALWALPLNPVTKFLTRNDNLREFAARGRLPPPRPLFGCQNRILAQAHLAAALQEGEQDVDALAGIFSRSLVDLLLGKGFVAERHALRERAGVEGLVRAPLAGIAARTVANPLRLTVTDAVVRVLDANGGRTLVEVDRAVVESRFYPGRIFPVGDDRFEVQANTFDPQRGELRARQVPAESPLTRPKLATSFEGTSLAGSPQDIRAGRLAYQLASFETDVVESVTGYRRADSGEEISYGAVKSRYRTRVRGILFPGAKPGPALDHLAGSFDSVLVAHLLAADEDIEVVAVDATFSPGLPGGLVVVDRNIQGMGVAEALDLAVVGEVLEWVRAILQGCKCAHGCPECTPRRVLERGTDKSGALRLLGA